MAVAVAGFDGNSPADQNSLESFQGRYILQNLRFILSGNYATNGDVLTLTPPPQGARLVSVRVFSCGPSGSIGANGGNFQYVPGAASLPTTSPNGKLKIYATAGTEYSAGAYSTDATTDIIFAEVKWARS